jgi:hypothetical protein
MSRHLHRALLLWLCLAPLSLAAQEPQPPREESTAAGAFRKEGDRLSEDCGFAPKKILGCALTLVTDHPAHLSQGSIAPQNGFGLGGALTWESNNQNFPWNMSADVVGAPSGAWRAGSYFKIRQADQSLPVPVGPGEGSSPSAFIRTIPIYSAFAQTIFLPTLPFYGLGNDTSRDDVAFFAMRQTLFGGNATYPIPLGSQSRVRVAVVGEATGRFIHTTDTTSDQPPLSAAPRLRASAPGFGGDRAFAQFGEGARGRIALGPRARLDYLGLFQQFTTSSDAGLSFRRWTLDLGHEISIYRRFKPVSKATEYGPNSCELRKDERCLPDVEQLRATDRSWNKTGTVGARVLLSKSQTSGDNAVPFYFQRTLGGSDINGSRWLASYDDYRFRGPNVLLFQETVEHSIAGPVGAWIELNQGRVGLQQDALTKHLRSTIAIGASINAGAAPMLTVFWATGGPEGRHIAFVVNTALIGGGSRPSLY